MFDINQDLFADGELDEKGKEEYSKALLALFEASPEGLMIAKKYGSLRWAFAMLDMNFNYIQDNLPDIDSDDFCEILFDLLPEKESVSADAATAIIEELRAFWSFLAREFKLSNADDILAELNQDAEEELHDLLDDPDNFGIEKSLMAMAQTAGFDMSTQEGVNAFMTAFNAAPKF
jgi:hypothetical protein